MRWQSACCLRVRFELYFSYAFSNTGGLYFKSTSSKRHNCAIHKCHFKDTWLFMRHFLVDTCQGIQWVAQSMADWLLEKLRGIRWQTRALQFAEKKLQVWFVERSVNIHRKLYLFILSLATFLPCTAKINNSFPLWTDRSVLSASSLVSVYK